MISEMAVEDIDVLIKEGINIKPQDIIRLNALGLKATSNQNSSYLYVLPRCSLMKHDEHQIVLRQPTLGHQIWFQNISRLYDDEDTLFFLRIWSLTLEVDDLPDFDKIDVKELKKFISKKLSHFTIEQIINALTYVEYGNNHLDEEYPISSKEFKGEIPDGVLSVEAGLIDDTKILGLGISTQDAMKMTRSQIESVIEQSLDVKNGSSSTDNKNNKAMGEYLDTLNNIRKLYKSNNEV